MAFGDPDDDGDGAIDEDPIDFIDNDGDGAVDEDGRKFGRGKRPKSKPSREGDLAFVPGTQGKRRIELIKRVDYLIPEKD